MIISIHQPQYLPWLPYYSKIARSDIFIFLDDVQYQKNGLQNRNELKNSNGRFWLTVPVSVNLGDKLNEVKIVKSGWSIKHIKSISLNYAKASNFKHSFPITCQDDFDNFISFLPPSDGPIFANIKIESKNPPRSLPILDGVELKNRFRRSLGFDPL